MEVADGIYQHHLISYSDYYVWIKDNRGWFFPKECDILPDVKNGLKDLMSFLNQDDKDMWPINGVGSLCDPSKLVYIGTTEEILKQMRLQYL